MTSIYIQLLLALEAALVAIITCVILAFKIKALNKTIANLKEKIKAHPTPTQSTNTNTDNITYLNKQLQVTEDNFNQLHINKDINSALNDQIVNIQAISLRFHVLQAEYLHLTTHNKETSFDSIIHTYETHIQLLLKNAGEQQITTLKNEIGSLQDKLMQNKKTISHLESLKHHYSDLEEQLTSCQNEAQTHIGTLQGLEDELNPDIKHSLEAYTKSYDEMAELLNDGKQLHLITSNSADAEQEIESLRLFAANQHKMIEELQAKLRNQSKISHDEETMDHITNELSKHKQFMKESETCIQLMEDELANASREIRGLKAQIKIQSEQQADDETKDLELSLLKEENKKLKEQLA